jgi:hypothetical protein
MPSRVAVSHNPGRPWWRSAWAAAVSGSITSRSWATARRSRGGSSRRAAATSPGSASAVTWAGRSWVPAASTPAWAAESWPAARAWAVAVSGPRNRARTVRTLWWAAPAPMPSRRRSQPAVEGGLEVVFGAGGPAGIHPGQLGQPLSFQPAQQPPPLEDPLGPNRIGEPGQVLGGQPLDGRGQGGQLIRRQSRMCVRVHGGNLSSPHPNTTTDAKMWTTFWDGGSSPLRLLVTRPIGVRGILGQRSSSSSARLAIRPSLSGEDHSAARRGSSVHVPESRAR